jgi:Fe(3+) dicitrate transport protein
MKTFIFITLTLVVSWLGATAGHDVIESPKGSIKGSVKDQTGQAAEGINVYLKGTVRGTVTDANGRFEIKNIPDGNYILVVQAVFVETVQQAVEVSKGQTLEVAIQIKESALSLAEIKIVSAKGLRELERMPEVEANVIYAGKKTEIINLANLDANLITNNTRQVFSKTPGVMIWENDGSGIQVGVAVRGLSPNRSWEFNVRQNGYDISSDPFGYPEAYYNPPMEAVERIQIVRGAAALQFGPQFGGLLNYVIKKGNEQKPFTFETQQSVGSYGLWSTFNAVGGTSGRLKYYAYIHHREADGWRNNSQYSITNAYGSLSYAFTPRFKLTAQLSRLYNESQQPGGLTDAQFVQNARQSNRSRNWFSTPWTVPSLQAEWAITEKSKLTIDGVALFGERNSIGFTRAINVLDVADAAGNFANRQIDRDIYRNAGAEARFTTRYHFFGKEHTLATGLKYFFGSTRRKQQGRGDTGSDFNLNLQADAFPRDVQFENTNVAAFAENIFRLSPKWTVTPGIRLETLRAVGEGRFSVNTNGTENRFDQQNTRQFVLLGVGSEYKLQERISLYSNFSQAYRPVLFSDITPAALSDFVIDPNLKDATGYNFDLGVRGSVRNYLNFDLSYFYLSYQDRIGTLTQIGADGRAFQYRTNLGQTVSKGLEAYLEFDPIVAFVGKSKVGYLSLFASIGYTDAQYVDFKSVSLSNNQLVETNLKGKKVENAPRRINRFGFNYTKKNFTLTWLINQVGETFSDANNTVLAGANAQTGLIPAYQVMDVSATYKFLKKYNVKAGVNNLTDERYFTRRAGGYPGPGILPGDGRNAYLSVGATF